MENSASGNVSAGEAMLTRRIQRTAYKGKATFWRTSALAAITLWAFTLGLLLWSLRRPVEIIKVIPPTVYEGARK